MMKTFLISIFIFITSFLSAQSQIVDIPNKDLFDKYWSLVEDKNSENESLKEWIPSFESEKTWTKSFGIQHYKMPEDYDIHYFYQMFIETLSKDFKEGKEPFKHKVHEKDMNHILFSWWSNGPDLEIGREWIHILKSKDNQVLFVRFATKNFKEDQDDSIWRECLKKAAFLQETQ